MSKTGRKALVDAVKKAAKGTHVQAAVESIATEFERQDQDFAKQKREVKEMIQNGARLTKHRFPA